MTGLIAALLVAVGAGAQTIELAVPGNSVKLTLGQLKEKLQPQAFKIDDPNYKQIKEFDGFPLEKVLELAGLKQDTPANELIFTSLDGYAPSTSVEKFRKHQAYLVFQEKGRPFSSLNQGKAAVSPAPFYVVWKEGAKLKNEVPWPYQIVKIELVDWKLRYPKVVSRDPQAQPGFILFKDHCLRCHSINLQGGELGPELNVPKNVTEYWRPKELKGFIKNASSYHARSKMPAFTHLRDEDIDKILVYLKAMKNQKI